MSSVPSQTIQVSISAARVRLADGESIHCGHCGSELELHQPDAYDPDRWLGTCDSCGSWHLIGLVENGAQAVVALLPTAQILSETSGGRRLQPESAPKKSPKPHRTG